MGSYRKNACSVYSCRYHVVFCPKYRRKVLTGGVPERFRELALAAAEDNGFEIEELEVMPDHVHMLVSLPPTLAPGAAIKRIKGATSRKLRDEFPWLRSRLPTLWTNAYFVSTVGGTPLAAVKQYIKMQKTDYGQEGRMG